MNIPEILTCKIPEGPYSLELESMQKEIERLSIPGTARIKSKIASFSALLELANGCPKCVGCMRGYFIFHDVMYTMDRFSLNESPFVVSRIKDLKIKILELSK